MKILLKIAATAIIVVGGYFYSRSENPLETKVQTETDISHDLDSETKNTKKSKGNKRLLELPGKMSRTPERIIQHTGYTLSFNREHNQPNWVAWELTADETDGIVQRTNDFQPDPELPSPHQVTTEDYKNSGYDRGHMAPAADMKWSSKAMKECFYMSNMCPQHGSLNSGAWSALEKACRRWAQQEGRIYIACGPIFKSRKHKTIGKDHLITVPDAFYKVVLSMQKGKEKAIGFYYTNKGGKQLMSKTATTVDEIEAITGIDFFVNIPDKIEKKVESEYSLEHWN